ncbi:MAG: hypothetical protein AMXMBFR84_08760 [Candidatus Hydrogenedentota bacterium]
MTSSKDTPELRIATLEEILALRDQVLIRGTDRTSPEFDGDRDTMTIHLGAFWNGAAIGCASLYPRQFTGEDAWQLRGMATAPEWRNQGIGGALLRFAENLVLANHQAKTVWCNARTSAVQFYVRHGWLTVSDVFEIKGVGPHIVMIKKLIA